MSIDVRRRLASFAFVALLILSVSWPSPIVAVNRLCCNAAIGIDELSFLGREALSWDVAFWCLAGILLLAMLQSGEYDRRDLRAAGAVVLSIRPRLTRRVFVVAAAAAAAVALIWIFADEPVTAWTERVRTGQVEDAIRIVNRFGGGMNPAMIVLFFLVAGVVYRTPRWVEHAVAMAIAGLAAGLLAQGVKYLVGRTRPELWLGAFHHARASASSFPSGHTVGAFALAGVLIFRARSTVLRVAAVLLASAVGFSRVLAFRHWLSDVVASAAIGLLFAWVVVTAITNERERRA